MTDRHEPVPKDPPAPVETPESRMTGEGAPPPEPEEDKGPQDGPEYEATEPASEPSPAEPPD
ncbi:hypothetical protein [Streptomyces sp. NRRL S-350]|uniref:hypothetical protein n=1 Tax=Streptomyces sp. NRRL S-350 TaxID=1463902 RepID=UPI0004C2559F|nr:hypothetical protein [Streptomyces sp. NRRL S-350]